LWVIAKELIVRNSELALLDLIYYRSPVASLILNKYWLVELRWFLESESSYRCKTLIDRAPARPGSINGV
jgi:hypothetical protein